MIVELRTLVAISRAGTFAAAADRIGLTQAAVSGHVKRLEDHLGFALFERTGRRATLTSAGVRTLNRAQELVERFDALGNPDDSEREAELKIGAIASVHPSLLAQALSLFHDAYPRVRVSVLPGLALNLLDQVDAAELDLAIIIQPPFGLPSELDFFPLLIERYVLIAPRECDGRDWRDLLRERAFLRYDKLSFGGRQVERFIDELPFPVRTLMEVPVNTMISMVNADMGVALIPLTEAHLPLPPGVCAIELNGARLERTIGMVRSTRRFDDPALSYLVECLAQTEEMPD